MSKGGRPAATPYTGLMRLKIAAVLALAVVVVAGVWALRPARADGEFVLYVSGLHVGKGNGDERGRTSRPRDRRGWQGQH